MPLPSSPRDRTSQGIERHYAARYLDRALAKRLRDQQSHEPHMSQTEQLLLAGLARVLERLADCTK